MRRWWMVSRRRMVLWWWRRPCLARPAPSTVASCSACKSLPSGGSGEGPAVPACCRTPGAAHLQACAGQHWGQDGEASATGPAVGAHSRDSNKWGKSASRASLWHGDCGCATHSGRARLRLQAFQPGDGTRGQPSRADAAFIAASAVALQPVRVALRGRQQPQVEGEKITAGPSTAPPDEPRAAGRDDPSFFTEMKCHLDRKIRGVCA